MRLPVSIVHGNRRFVAWPQPDSAGWCWREHGCSQVFTATSEQSALACISGYCRVGRGRIFHNFKELET